MKHKLIKRALVGIVTLSMVVTGLPGNMFSGMAKVTQAYAGDNDGGSDFIDDGANWMVDLAQITNPNNVKSISATLINKSEEAVNGCLVINSSKYNWEALGTWSLEAGGSDNTESYKFSIDVPKDHEFGSNEAGIEYTQFFINKEPGTS